MDDARYLHLGRIYPRAADTNGAIASRTTVAAPDRIVARDDSSASPTATKCPKGDNSGICEKSVTGSTFTLPIVLGVAIPVVASAILFFFLHRRYLRKQREEDNNERHASLDFGMGDIPQPGRIKKKGIAGLTMPGEKGHRQVSMDMALASPYLLPPELHDSRESLQSLSRTMNHEDPYRPVAQLQDAASIRSASRNHDGRGLDAASIMTGSSNAYSYAPSKLQEASSADLLSNASRMARNNPPMPAFVAPPRENSLPPKNPFSNASEIPRENARTTPPYPVEGGSITPPYPVEPAQAHIQQPSTLRKGLPSSPFPSSNLTPAATPSSDGRESVTNSSDDGLRHSNNYLGAFINAKDLDKAADNATSPKPSAGLPSNPRPAHKESTNSAELPPSPPNDENEYGDGFKITPPSPRLENAELRDRRYSMDVPPEEFVQAGLGAPGFDARRLSMGFRPLPPDAVNEVDDPELRANRIRSFYKEYFDESKPAPEGQYYEDYDQNYLGDGAYYDPGSNNFVMPYAQPVTRRAMTPPPRGPPRFQGPPRGVHSSMGGMNMNGMGPMGPMGPMGGMRGVPGPRAYSSASGRMPPGPRAQSSASQRMGGGPRGRPLPPPEDLPTLPTPSKLRDDSFALFNAMDFAPPSTYRDRVAGRSESPLGERRPYSPAVPSFIPTNSAFDELPDMPTPHSLRKSGTFTGLDFAPPKRFKDPDTMSDAGSIRSNRSGVSAMQLGAIRSGAYRVSRLPQDMVGTKDDLAASLKPQWGMRPAAA